MSQRAWGVAGILILFSPLLGGCIVTQTMWHKVGVTSYNYPEITGTVRPAMGVPARWIVVRYELDNSDWRLHYDDYTYRLISLSADGKPSPPFRYEGDLQTSSAVEKGLPEVQRVALRRATLTLACPPGQRPDTIAGYVPVDARFPNGSGGGGGYSPPFDSIVLLIRLSRDGSGQLVWESNDDPSLPGTTVVVVPFAIARPADEQRRARTAAALLTPIALLADVVVTPVLLGAYILRGGG